MHHFDLTPLYRSAANFDGLAATLRKASALTAAHSNYPPCNIEKTAENKWRISLAVAGFSHDDLAVESQEDHVVVTGTRKNDGADRTFLHQGIARRSFERRFQLAEHMRVTGAALIDGLLHIDLTRVVPEALMPRRIAIANPEATQNEAGEAVTEAVTGAGGGETETITAMADDRPGAE